jgi:hypothetical protein
MRSPEEVMLIPAGNEPLSSEYDTAFVAFANGIEFD